MAIIDTLVDGAHAVTNTLDAANVTSLVEVDNNLRGVNPGQQGIFGLHPLMTPKYARNTGLRDNEFKDTLARMYVSLPTDNPTLKEQYLAALPDDPTRALASRLTGTGFVDFFLAQAQEPFTEALQVDKVLGDNYVAFYFGSEPPVFSYSGYLLNSQQDDQRTGFARAYQYLIRGTKLARSNSIVRLRYDSVLVSGTINAYASTINAENELLVPFQFSLLVKEYVLINPSSFVKMKDADYVQLAKDTTISQFMTPAGQPKNIRIRTITIAPEAVAAATASPTETPPVAPPTAGQGTSPVSQAAFDAMALAEAHLRDATTKAMHLFDTLKTAEDNYAGVQAGGRGI